jgi:aldehyde dehydrogenase (NAD+)
MRDYPHFYIDGEWVEPHKPRIFDVLDPSTEEVAGRIRLGDEVDVDRAVQAARRAFSSWSQSSRETRLEVLEALASEYDRRSRELSALMSEEMGAPAWLADDVHVMMGRSHLRTAIDVLRTYSFEELRGSTLVAREPVGVCAFITPWNFPMNQVACKVAPALATGCSMVLKPSEIAPFSAQLFAEICDSAGVPPGVFNLIQGDGPTVGAALSSHRDVDMVSFTGSTRAGIEVARAAAPTIKRVHQELGGKSANIVLEDANFEQAIGWSVQAIMLNSGQNCIAPSRLLVPQNKVEEVKRLVARAVADVSVGIPADNAAIGPVVSATQWRRIQGYIETGIAEGATLVAGGPGRPEGLDRGYFVRPTVFADVTNGMTIAREEIFGPVLSIIGYADEQEAISIANDTDYGLAAYVHGEPTHARNAGRHLRAGQVNINGASPDFMAPFGGYKQSGNGREWGDHAFGEFLETKAMLGFEVPAATVQ